MKTVSKKLFSLLLVAIMLVSAIPVLAYADDTCTHENVTLFKQIVHNKNVNDCLTQLGIKIKDDINDISPDDFVILRAHGEPPETYRILNSKNSRIPKILEFLKILEFQKF